MFDYVRCEVPLPDGWTGELRTQAFDCVLATLLIRADGRLLVQAVESRDIAAVEKPHEDAAGAAPAAGFVRSAVIRWRELAFDGAFDFHRPPPGLAPGAAPRRYSACFDRGRLVSISVQGLRPIGARQPVAAHA